MENIKISSKIALLLLILVILPNFVVVTLIDISKISDAFFYLTCYTVALLVLIIPISKLIAYMIVNNDLAKINKTFKCVKKGNYCRYFSLPNEKENESDIIALKRNINWMMHSVSKREDTLHLKIEKEKSIKKIFEKQSNIDGLTKIYNRRYFDDKLHDMLSTAQASTFNIALIMIDCDYFKEVNDTHGHQAGDTILILLGSILKNVIRTDADCPFRYGGDEFGIIILNTPVNRLFEIAEKIQKEFSAKNKYNTSLSIGIANCIDTFVNSINAESLKKLADQALYESKENGRNKITIKEF